MAGGCAISLAAMPYACIDSATVSATTPRHPGHSFHRRRCLSMVLAAALTPAAAAAQSLPLNWSSADIGSPGVQGSASYDGGTFTVRGAGSGTQTASDQFQFVYRPVSGNVDLIAR